MALHRSLLLSREEARRSQNAQSADDEDIQLTYSALPPGTCLHTPLAAGAHDGGAVPGQVLASRDAWPRSYHRLLTGMFLGAVFALGVLLGTVTSGSAVPRYSVPGSSTTPTHPAMNTTRATRPDMSGGGLAAQAVVDARYAIVTLGIRCIFNACAEGRLSVPAGQRVYAIDGGASCTTTSVVVLLRHSAGAAYCRLDQPSVFSASFDGALFDCVGSQLGCHFVVRVDTTNGR